MPPTASFIALQCFQCSTMQADISPRPSCEMKCDFSECWLMGLWLVFFSGEAAEEEQQQVDLCGVQREAVGEEGLCAGIDGQGCSQIRTVLQHVPEVH